MTFLYTFVLWGIFPLLFLLWKSKKELINFIHTLMLIFILIALARPIEPQVLEESKIKSKDIIIALDVSYSMNAKDISPSRYDFAKETISAYLALNPRDNVMLMAFTTNPLLLSPPTTDHPLILIALDSLNPEFILTKGTSLKRLFDKIATMDTKNKSMILMSDGGEESNILSLKESIEKSAISLHILALGTKKGTSIETKKGKLLKDKENNLVISRINPLLETLAEHINAPYFEASSSPQNTALALDKSLKQRHEESILSKKMQHQYKERYHLPLFLAVILFLLLHTRAIKYLLIFLALFGIQAEASLLDNYYLISAYQSYVQKDFKRSLTDVHKIEAKSLQSQLLLAHDYYQEEHYKKALKIYTSLRSSHIKTKQYIYYHIANTHAMLQAYDKAKIYYAKTLQLGKDEDAQYNLRLIALLKTEKEASLGIAHPKSQSDSSTANKNTHSEDKNEEDKKKEDKPSSNSNGQGEGSASKENKDKAPSTLIADEKEEENPHPLDSKVYELINKGYIREKRPW
ncbi:BatB [hydrothermal vent metagenome]|uniref:BatB n=1 Tax=hydrothermal vent metagenome TaxID=652676 RepID=A0A1W1CYV3_9ZZZZ